MTAWVILIIAHTTREESLVYPEAKARVGLTPK
jgi:hypothetical protein